MSAGCPFCAVGPDDECEMGCPSRSPLIGSHTCPACGYQADRVYDIACHAYAHGPAHAMRPDAS